MATIQISRVLLPLALIVLSACKPTVKDSETLGEARHREFFGIGPEISTWLFSDSVAPGQQCWYYKSVKRSEFSKYGKSKDQIQFTAMSRAEPITMFPLENKYIIEHLRFWGLLYSLSTLMDYVAGPASCATAASLSAGLLTPLAPVAFVGALGSGVLCGMSMYGVLTTNSTVKTSSSVFFVPGMELTSGSSPGRDEYQIQKTIYDAVIAKIDKSLVAKSQCKSAAAVMKPYARLFSQNDEEACGRLNSLSKPIGSLPSGCRPNPFAKGVNAGFCARVIHAPEGGTPVYSDRDFSRSVGFVGMGVELKIVERYVHTTNSKPIVVKARRNQGDFGVGGEKEAWMLAGFLEEIPCR